MRDPQRLDLFGLTASREKGRAPLNASFQVFLAAFGLKRGDKAARAWLREIQANNVGGHPDNSIIVAAAARREVDMGLVTRS